MRLVEICVDGGLEATMYSAQAQLADAYITAGAASEARFIAEDLVAREPWDRANIERFRRTLVLMGEPDPDGLIAERLSGEFPFMSTDLSLRGEELPPFEPPVPDPTPLEGAAGAEPALFATAIRHRRSRSSDPSRPPREAADRPRPAGKRGGGLPSPARRHQVAASLRCSNTVNGPYQRAVRSLRADARRGLEAIHDSRR